MVLKNIQPNSSLPDYIVTSDLIVPDGITLSIIEDDVIIAFESETGIHVQKGGTLTNVNETQAYGFTPEFKGDAGWKGIWIDNGTINLEHAFFVNGGKTAFSEQNEAAVIPFTGDESIIESLSDNEFIESNSYDILVAGSVNGQRTVTLNQFSFTIPIKAPITFMDTWFSDKANIYPETYDYVHLIPSGKTIKDEIPYGFTFSSSSKGTYCIDGDFCAGSNILIGDGCTILMKEGAAILTAKSFSVSGNDEGVTISGIDGSNWKGIAALGGISTFKKAIIKNAGNGIIQIGDFTAAAAAAIYTNSSSGSVEDCEIVNSGGFGIYNADESVRSALSVERTSF